MTPPKAERTGGARRLLLVALGLALAAQAPQPAGPAAVVVSFQVDQAEVEAGTWVEFTWASRGAEWVELEPLGIRLPPTGQISHRPPASATYWLSAINTYGGESAPVTIVVQPVAALAPAVPVPTAPAPAPAGEARPAPEPEPIQPVAAGPGKGGAFWVQFAALADPVAAQAFARRLGRTLREPAGIELAMPAGGDGASLFRVHTGPYPTRAVALAKLREARRRIPARVAQPLVVKGSPALPEQPGPRPPRRHRKARI